MRQTKGLDEITKYNPGDIIKYRDNYGLKKTYYGIIKEPYPSYVTIFTESRLEKELDLFLDSTVSSTTSTIEKILTLEEFTSIVKGSQEYDDDKEYLLGIAELLEKVKSTKK